MLSIRANRAFSIDSGAGAEMQLPIDSISSMSPLSLVIKFVPTMDFTERYGNKQRKDRELVLFITKHTWNSHNSNWSALSLRLVFVLRRGQFQLESPLYILWLTGPALRHPYNALQFVTIESSFRCKICSHLQRWSDFRIDVGCSALLSLAEMKRF